MSDFVNHHTLLLAQDIKPNAGTKKAPANTQQGTTQLPDGTTQPGVNPPPNQTPGGGGFLIIMILILVVFWVFAMGGQKKEKKKRQEMLDQLKKGDKVQTIGGIIGNVVEVKDTHVVLKVDENSNTRLKFGRGAIQGVIADDEKPKE